MSSKMPTRSTNRLFVVAALAFAAALAPVIVGAWLLYESAVRRDEERFHQLLAAVQTHVAHEDERYVDFLRSVAVECAAGMTEEQWKWRRTTDEWPERFPQLASVGWAQNTAELREAGTHFLASRDSATAAPLALGQEAGEGFDGVGGMGHRYTSSFSGDRGRNQAVLYAESAGKSTYNASSTNA